MKTIEYKIHVQSVNGNTRDFKVEVRARDINSGFVKAVKLAKSYMARYDEMSSVVFWQVV